MFDFSSVDFEMRFITHSKDIPVGNIDDFSSCQKTKEKRHSELLPNNLRCIIAGMMTQFIRNYDSD